MRGTVAGWLSCGLVDGPGSRFVLFLQGCNMACPTCHNFYTQGTCGNCGTCVEVCSSGALGMEAGRRTFAPGLCKGCHRCLNACPAWANPQAREMTVVEVVEIIRPYRPFLSGITVSGGEATCQWQFVRALALACQGDLGLATLVDSNGLAEEGVWRQLLPAVAGVLLDIKALDNDLHRKLTGRDNGPVLRSLDLLHRASKLVEVRHLLIPGLTADPSHFLKVAALVAGLDPQPPLRLQAYSNARVRGKSRVIPALDESELLQFADLARQQGVKLVRVSR